MRARDATSDAKRSRRCTTPQKASGAKRFACNSAQHSLRRRRRRRRRHAWRQPHARRGRHAWGRRRRRRHTRRQAHPRRHARRRRRGSHTHAGRRRHAWGQHPHAWRGPRRRPHARRERPRRRRIPRRRHARRRHASPVLHHVVRRRRRHAASVRHHVRHGRRHPHRQHASWACSEERVRPPAQRVFDGAGGQQPLRRRAVAFAARVLLVGVRHADWPVAQELAVHGVDGGVAGVEGVEGDEAEAAAVALRSRGGASERAAGRKGGETLAPVQKRALRRGRGLSGAPCRGRASAWAW